MSNLLLLLGGLILLSSLSSVNSSLSCFFDTVNTTHVTELPNTLSCSCKFETEYFSLFGGEILEGGLTRDLVSRVHTVSITRCETLVLNLTHFPSATDNGTIAALFPFDSKVNIIITEATQVELLLQRSALSLLEQIFMANVTHSEISFVDEDDASSSVVLILGVTTETFYMYLSIALGALVVLLVIVMASVGVCACAKKRKSCCAVGKTGKKVSRAESWRYESNMFINPTPRQMAARNGNNGIGNAIPPRSPTQALQQMLPFHMMPQPEVALNATNGTGTGNSYGTREEHGTANSYGGTGEERYPLTQTQGFFEEDQAYNTGQTNVTGSYGSRNKSDTLQMNR